MLQLVLPGTQRLLARNTFAIGGLGPPGSIATKDEVQPAWRVIADNYEATRRCQARTRVAQRTQAVGRIAEVERDDGQVISIAVLAIGITDQLGTQGRVTLLQMQGFVDGIVCRRSKTEIAAVKINYSAYVEGPTRFGTDFQHIDALAWLELGQDHR